MTTTKAEIPDRAQYRIGEASEIIGVKPYVLRYWETEFAGIKPSKSSAGHRVYRKTDLEMLILIRDLLHAQRYSVEGAKKRLRELKKSGDLKEARESAFLAASSGAQASDASVSSEHIGALSGVSLETLWAELSELAARPVSELFQLAESAISPPQLPDSF